jgi:hypothetical protein
MAARPLLALLVLWIVGVGCAVLAVPTPTPAARGLPRGAVPAAAATSAFTFGGLGVARLDWERDHGRPDDIPALAGSNFVSYDRGKYVVSYMGDRAFLLDCCWTADFMNPRRMARQDADAVAHSLMPPDARVVRSYRQQAPDAVITVYSSGALVGRFRPGDATRTGTRSWVAWDGGEPGTFYAKLVLASDGVRVNMVTVGLGDGRPGGPG